MSKDSKDDPIHELRRILEELNATYGQEGGRGACEEGRKAIEKALQELVDLREVQRQNFRRMELSGAASLGLGANPWGWGRLAEGLLVGDLAELLGGRGVRVHRVLSRVCQRLDGGPWQADLLAIGDESAVVTGLAATLGIRHVTHFVSRILGNARECLPYLSGRRLYGALGHMAAEEGARAYAEEKGLFVIEVGKSGAGLVNGEDFLPRTF